MGSVAFAKDIVRLHKELKTLGHTPLIHELMFNIADGTAEEIISRVPREHAELKREHDFIRWWYNCIVSGDAILVCNMDKKGIRNYIGGNTLMEIGFAHVHEKKVFLLNPIPEGVPYVDEIKAMTDVVLDGNLGLIR